MFNETINYHLFLFALANELNVILINCPLINLIDRFHFLANGSVWMFIVISWSLRFTSVKSYLLSFRAFKKKVKLGRKLSSFELLNSDRQKLCKLIIWIIKCTLHRDWPYFRFSVNIVPDYITNIIILFGTIWNPVKTIWSIWNSF